MTEVVSEGTSSDKARADEPVIPQDRLFKPLLSEGLVTPEQVTAVIPTLKEREAIGKAIDDLKSVRVSDLSAKAATAQTVEREYRTQWADSTKKPFLRLQPRNGFVTTSKPYVVAAIPAYNDEKNLAKVIVVAKKYVDKVIVCDDGSLDLTAEIAKSLGVEVVRHERNMGYGAAIATLFEKAIEAEADFAVTIDGDGQHNPEDIPRLIDEIEKGDADIVIGSRFLNGGSGVPKYREAGIRMINGISGALAFKSVTDSQSGLRAYNRRALAEVCPSEMGMGASTEILSKARKTGMRISVLSVENSTIAIGIPAKNEARNIAPVIIGALRISKNVIVVDDGSIDDTRIIAQEMGATVISHKRNMGKGAAFRTLFKTAREMNADTLVTMDADGQHDWNDIPKLLAKTNEYDIVIGARSSRPENMPTTRRWAQVFLDMFSTVDSEEKITDSQSGFRAYSKHALENLNVTEEGIGVDMDIIKQAGELGLSITQVPVGIKYHRDGTRVKEHKENSVLHFTDVLSTIFKREIIRRPVRLLGLPGLLFMLTGLAGWANVAASYFQNHALAVGQALLFSIMLLVGFILIIQAITLLALKIQIQELKS